MLQHLMDRSAQLRRELIEIESMIAREIPEMKDSQTQTQGQQQQVMGEFPSHLTEILPHGSTSRVQNLLTDSRGANLAG